MLDGQGITVPDWDAGLLRRGRRSSALNGPL